MTSSKLGKGLHALMSEQKSAITEAIQIIGNQLISINRLKYASLEIRRVANETSDKTTKLISRKIQEIAHIVQNQFVEIVTLTQKSCTVYNIKH